MTVLFGRIETSEAARCVNTERPLTRSSDSTREGLAVNATRTCVTANCDRPVRCRNLCNRHYQQRLKSGFDETTARRVITPEMDRARFWAKVDKRGPEECWPWTGVLVAGYGQFAAQGVRYLAHRFMHLISIGPVPDGYEVDHVKARGCTRTDCVNPAHLEAVTPRENKLRSNNVAGVNARKTTCHKGHSGLRRMNNGERYCPTCRSEYDRKRRAQARDR